MSEEVLTYKHVPNLILEERENIRQLRESQKETESMFKETAVKFKETDN